MSKNLKLQKKRRNLRILRLTKMFRRLIKRRMQINLSRKLRRLKKKMKRRMKSNRRQLRKKNKIMKQESLPLFKVRIFNRKLVRKQKVLVVVKMLLQKKRNKWMMKLFLKKKNWSLHEIRLDGGNLWWLRECEKYLRWRESIRRRNRWRD